MTITDTAGVSISDAAELTGVSAHTLRYYERTGLMFTPVDRASSTHRRYTEADIARLALLLEHRTSVVAQLNEMTNSLAAIDFKIATYRKGTPTK